jgi:hypothetical protein
MANKWLLSLLFLISFTNLFWTNAEVTSCYSGSSFIEEEFRTVEIQNCSNEENYGCYRKVQGGETQFGCVDEKKCNANHDGEENYIFYTCCLEDNCNNN